MSYSLNLSIEIAATPQQVWDVITNPEIISEVFFGTNFTATWEVGGRIEYSGEWEGKQYVDGGEILEIEPGRILRTTYWSSMSGTEDKPENYSEITYLLEAVEAGTKFTLKQDKFVREEQRDHSIQGWTGILAQFKEKAEG